MAVSGGYHFEVSGAPDSDAASILFLHGFSEDLSTWRTVADALAPDFRIVLVDLIGHGRSARPTEAEPYRLDAIVDALDRVREDAGLRRFHLVGYSMGGRVALAYAARHGAHLDSLVLESSSLGPADEEQRASAELSDRRLAARVRACADGEEFADFWETVPVLADQRTLPEEARATIRSMRAANDPQALALTVEWSGQARMPNLRPELDGFGFPLVYFVGSRDEKYAALASQFERDHGVAVRRFEAGHNVHQELPAQYAAALRDFYADIRQRRGGRDE